MTKYIFLQNSYSGLMHLNSKNIFLSWTKIVNQLSNTPKLNWENCEFLCKKKAFAYKFHWLKYVVYLNFESVHPPPPPRPILGARDPQEYICWSSCSSTSLSRIRLATLKLAGLSQINNENMFFFNFFHFIYLN